MAKRRKKTSDALIYHLRVTEHRDFPKKRHLPFEKRKITKHNIKLLVPIEIIDPESRQVIKHYKKKVIGWETRYDEGNVVRYSRSFYLHNREEVKRVMKKNVERFKKTKRDDISATSQLIQGKITNKRRAFLQKGSKVSKAAKFLNIERQASTGRILNRERDLMNAVDKFELEYRIGSEAQKIKRLERTAQQKVSEKRNASVSRKGRFILSTEEKRIQQKFRKRVR